MKRSRLAQFLRTANLLSACAALVVLASTSHSPAQPAASEKRAGHSFSGATSEAFPLSWSAPAGCPKRARIRKQLESWLGAPLVFDKPLSVDARVTRSLGPAEPNRFVVALRLSYGDDSGTRRVEFNHCAEAADFVALSIALAVEPGFVPQKTTQTPDAAGEAAREPDAAGEAPSGQDPSHPAPNETDSVQAGPAAAPDPVDPATQTPLSEPENESPREAPTVWTGRGPIHLGLTARLSTGALPRTQVGVALQAGYRIGMWMVRIDGFLFPPREGRILDAPNPVRSNSWGSSFGGCRLIAQGGMTTGICAAAQLASVRAREMPPNGARGHEGNALWLALFGGLEGSIAISRWIGLAWAVGGLIPLVRPIYTLSDGTEVFESSFGFQAELGTQIFF